jgi:hypothetical protein
VLYTLSFGTGDVEAVTAGVKNCLKVHELLDVLHIPPADHGHGAMLRQFPEGLAD